MLHQEERGDGQGQDDGKPRERTGLPIGIIVAAVFHAAWLRAWS
jgi:hypothetical protein